MKWSRCVFAFVLVVLPLIVTSQNFLPPSLETSLVISGTGTPSNPPIITSGVVQYITSLQAGYNFLTSCQVSATNPNVNECNVYGSYQSLGYTWSWTGVMTGGSINGNFNFTCCITKSPYTPPGQNQSCYFDGTANWQGYVTVLDVCVTEDVSLYHYFLSLTDQSLIGFAQFNYDGSNGTARLFTYRSPFTGPFHPIPEICSYAAECNNGYLEQRRRLRKEWMVPSWVAPY